MPAKDPAVNSYSEREYTENTKNRKKQLVELKSGETKEIEVAYGTMRVTSDSGRGIYKMVKRAMTGKQVPTKSKRVESIDANGNRVIAAQPDASGAKVYALTPEELNSMSIASS